MKEIRILSHICGSHTMLSIAENLFGFTCDNLKCELMKQAITLDKHTLWGFSTYFPYAYTTRAHPHARTRTSSLSLPILPRLYKLVITG